MRRNITLFWRQVGTDESIKEFCGSLKDKKILEELS
jgi:hypothetical protein